MGASIARYLYIISHFSTMRSDEKVKNHKGTVKGTRIMYMSGLEGLKMKDRKVMGGIKLIEIKNHNARIPIACNIAKIVLDDKRAKLRLD